MLVSVKNGVEIADDLADAMRGIAFFRQGGDDDPKPRFPSLERELRVLEVSCPKCLAAPREDCQGVRNPHNARRRKSYEPKHRNHGAVRDYRKNREEWEWRNRSPSEIADNQTKEIVNAIQKQTRDTITAVVAAAIWSHNKNRTPDQAIESARSWARTII